MIVRIGSREVGDGRPCYVIAELGVNHQNDRNVMLRMVEEVAAAGADAVKIQSYHRECFVTARARYNGESQADLFDRYEMSEQAQADVAQRCKQLGVDFFGTPDCLRAAKLLIDLGAEVLKVGSDDLTTIPLLRQFANLGRPMILSTGMASDSEIKAALRVTDGWRPDYRNGPREQPQARVPALLLHCVSSYPTPPDQANLRRIPALRVEFGSLVGYSDHTDGIDAAVGAFWLGAVVVEKHFSLDRNMEGPDHAFSADPAQLREMVKRIRLAERMRGNGLTPDDSEMRITARRSVVAARSLARGEIIGDEALAYKRPGDGLPPVTRDRMVGKRLTRALEPDEQFREGDWE